jgi:rare lipoprotein A
MIKIVSLILAVIIFYGCSSTPRIVKGGSGSADRIIRYKTEKSVEVGTASFYAHKYHGKLTANGEIYDMSELTAAHGSLPFNTVVKVTNLKNSRTVILRINDRMPYYKGRIIDVSYRAAKELGMLTSGLAKVQIEILKWGD